MSAFNIWRDNPPLPSTWVWAKYSLTRDDWQMVKSCKRGCCVYSFGVNLMLPKYWKPASEQEATEAQATSDKITPIDPWALYETPLARKDGR